MSETVHCDDHGATPATIVCAHVVQTLNDGHPRGFVWSLDDEGDYQAVCSSCSEMAGDEWADRAVALGRVLCLECFFRAAALNGVPKPGVH